MKKFYDMVRDSYGMAGLYCMEYFVKDKLKMNAILRPMILTFLSREECLSCHSCCDTGPRLLQSCQLDRPN